MWKQRIVATATLVSAALSVAFPFTTQTTDRAAPSPIPVRSPAPGARVLPLAVGDADFGLAGRGSKREEGPIGALDRSRAPGLAR